MTIFNFLLLVLAATAAYILGDMLACAGMRHNNTVLHRIGCLLVAAAVVTMALLFLELWSVR